MQVIGWSPNAQDSIIATFLRWDFKGDGCAESSEGDPFLPTASKRVRRALSTELKENTLTVAPKDHRYSTTVENTFFQKDIPTSSQKTQGNESPTPHGKLPSSLTINVSYSRLN